MHRSVKVNFTSYACSLCKISSKWQNICYLASALGRDVGVFATDPGLGRGNCSSETAPWALSSVQVLGEDQTRRTGRVSRSATQGPLVLCVLGCYWLLRSLVYLDQEAGNVLLEAAFLQRNLQRDSALKAHRGNHFKYADYINHPLNLGITREGKSV